MSKRTTGQGKAEANRHADARRRVSGGESSYSKHITQMEGFLSESKQVKGTNRRCSSMSPAGGQNTSLAGGARGRSDLGGGLYGELPEGSGGDPVTILSSPSDLLLRFPGP